MTFYGSFTIIKSINRQGDYVIFTDKLLCHFQLQFFLNIGGSSIHASMHDDNEENLQKKFMKFKLYMSIWHPDYQVLNLEIMRCPLIFLKLGLTKDFSFEDTDYDLVEGLTKLQDDHTFYEGFKLVVGWLDTIEGKGKSGYCKYRDVLSHTGTGGIGGNAHEYVMKKSPKIKFFVLNKKIVKNKETHKIDTNDSETLTEYKKLTTDLLTHIKQVFIQERTSTI